MRPGDPVRLHCPENPRLDGQAAEVAVVTPWGAHLRCPAAATGRFRATFAEMVPEGQQNGHGYTGDVCQQCGGSKMVRNGSCVLCLDCGTTTGCS